MATEQSKKNIAPININGDELENREASAKPKSKTRGEKTSKASTQEVLSRKEKLESVKKANQALMKALELMSQRNGNKANDQGDI
jgi:hypothetical protein